MEKDEKNLSVSKRERDIETMSQHHQVCLVSRWWITIATGVPIALTWAVDPRDTIIKALRMQRMEKRGRGCREDVRVCGHTVWRWRGVVAKR